MLGHTSKSLEAVLRLLVPPQVHFPLEAFAAQVAAKRLVPRVLPAVCNEVGALAEGLPTHLALVWLLACKAHTGTSNMSTSRSLRDNKDFQFFSSNLPVWMNVCFFMSDFWWNLLPQNWQG